MPDNYFDFSNLQTTRNRPYDADNLNYIYGRLKERGYDDKHIAVLLGTIAEESGGDPYAVSPDGKFQGLLQWAGDRYAINPFMAENPRRELDRQIDYIARTIDNLDDSKSWTHGGKGSGYNRAADAHEAYVSSDSLDAINHAFNRGYVRPTGGDDSVANRYKVAEQVYNIISNQQPMSMGRPEPTAQPPLKEAAVVRPKSFTVPSGLRIPQDVEPQPFYDVEPNIYRPGGKLRNAVIRRWYNKNVQPKVEELGIDEVRKRLYDNISPVGYEEAKERIGKALENEKSYFDQRFENKYRDDIWATYLSIPEQQRHNNEYKVNQSSYTPSKSNDIGAKYYSINIAGPEQFTDRLVEEGIGAFRGQDSDLANRIRPLEQGESTTSGVLGNFFGTHTIGRNIDPNKGEYISYYDLWDIAPVGRRGLPDQTQGLGKPMEFYDRIYLDDYFGVNTNVPQDSYYGGYIAPAFKNAYTKDDDLK